MVTGGQLGLRPAKDPGDVLELSLLSGKEAEFSLHSLDIGSRLLPKELTPPEVIVYGPLARERLQAVPSVCLESSFFYCVSVCVCVHLHMCMFKREGEIC